MSARWRVESTLIDEYVPAPREAWRVVNDAGEVADDSLTEDYDTAVAMADELNAEGVQGRWTICNVDGKTLVIHGADGKPPWLIVNESVPVVPCDEAAVERVAKASYEGPDEWGRERHEGATWERLVETTPSIADIFRERARIWLRAAGADS